MSTDELEKQILLALDAGKEVQTYTIAQEQGIDHQKVCGRRACGCASLGRPSAAFFLAAPRDADGR